MHVCFPINESVVDYFHHSLWGKKKTKKKKNSNHILRESLSEVMRGYLDQYTTMPGYIRMKQDFKRREKEEKERTISSDIKLTAKDQIFIVVLISRLVQGGCF